MKIGGSKSLITHEEVVVFNTYIIIIIISKCTGGADFRPLGYFLFCNLHEVSYKILNDEPISKEAIFEL